MQRVSEHEKAALRQGLLANVGALVAELFLHKPITETSHELRIGNRGGLCVDKRSGQWFDHETGEGGDLLALIQYATGCGFPEAIAFAKRWGGNTSNTRTCVREAVPPVIRTTTDEERQRLTREAALRLWQVQTRSIEGIDNPVALYLRQRGIVRDVWPSDMRFHPSLAHPIAGKRHPSMVCAFRDVSGDVQAIHRTFLTHHGHKLSGEGINAKLNLGSPKGCAIRLAPATDKVALCEGIEDALTVTQETGLPCWAVGNAAGLFGVVLPDSIREVIICADADDAGMKAAQKAMDRFLQQGRTVRLATPPHGFKDFNEAITTKEKGRLHAPLSHI